MTTTPMDAIETLTPAELAERMRQSRSTRQQLMQQMSESSQQEQALRLERNRRMLPVLKQLLPFLEHSRNSCSDTHPENAHTTAGRNGVPRCNKCFLMQLTEEDLKRVTLDIDLACAYDPTHLAYRG